MVMYVHGLGDEQERISRDYYEDFPHEIAWQRAKKVHVCPCCGSNEKLEFEDYEEDYVQNPVFYEILYKFFVYCCKEECEENEFFEIEYFHES